MKRLVALSCLMLLLSPLALAGGGGSKSKSKDNQQTPEQQAIAAYNQGIAQRDRAWKFEEKFAAATDADEQKNLEKKIYKTYETAAAAFERAIGHQPKMFEAHSDLGYCLRRLGNYEKSLKHYNIALEINPTYAEAIEYRGEAYLGLNRVDDAKEAYMTLFKGNSDQAPDLLKAFHAYVEKQQAAGNNVEELAAWVAERTEIAGQTKTMSQLKDSRW